MRYICTIVIAILSISNSYSQEKELYQNIKLIKSDSICIICQPVQSNSLGTTENSSGFFFLSNKFERYKSYRLKKHLKVISFKYNSDNYLFIGKKEDIAPFSEWNIRYYPTYDIFNTGLGENYSDSTSRILISDFFSSENTIPDYSSDDYYLEELIAEELRHNKNHYALQMYNEHVRFIFLNYTKKQEILLKNNFYVPYFLTDIKDRANDDSPNHERVYNIVLKHINLFYPTITCFDVKRNTSGINYKQIAEQLYHAFKPLNLNKRELEYDVVGEHHVFSNDTIQSANKQINIEISSIDSNVFVANLWITVKFEIMSKEYLRPISYSVDFPGYIVKIKFYSQNKYVIEFLRTFFPERISLLQASPFCANPPKIK